ncbi:MAG: lysylphosphatidylglycerol synthase transmembrane domain-containing protein [Chloroflexota bacterium]
MTKLRRVSLNTRWLRWAGTLISSALFIWLLVQQDWGMVWLSLSQTPVWLFPLAYVLYFGAILANALRWYVLLRSQDTNIPYSEVLKIVLSGNFASNFLPSTVGGDTVRLVTTSRFVGWTLGLTSIVVDRLINVFAMVALLPFSWITFQAVGWLAWIEMPALVQKWSYAAVGGLFGWGERLRKKIRQLVWKLKVAFNLWRNRLDVIFLALLISWGAKLMVFLGVWILARGLGMVVTFPQVIGVGAITYMLSLLPISINGFGLREVTMTTLYVQLGASWEQASALVVVTRFILMSETLPGAVWISGMLSAAEKSPAPAPGAPF